MQLIICRFCPCCAKFCRLYVFLITGPEHPRSNLVFEMRDDFIFGMLYCSILRKSCFALSLKGRSTIQPYKVSTL